MDEKIYAISKCSGDLIYRLPGKRYGDGQVDTDDHPVWLLADPMELSDAEKSKLPLVDDLMGGRLYETRAEYYANSE